MFIKPTKAMVGEEGYLMPLIILEFAEADVKLSEEEL
jgi:hypothetical protein